MFSKILIIFLFLIKLSLNFSFAENSEQIQKIKEYLKNAKIIRVYFGNSPSMGHQSNTYQMMSQLRGLGYNGVFEIVYNDDSVTYLSSGDKDLNTAQKMKYFFPDFDPNKKDVQSIENGKVITIPEKLFSKEYDKWKVADFAFTGGQDFHKVTAITIKSKAYLDLYPSGFGGLHPELIYYPSTFNPTEISVYNRYETPIFIPENLEQVEQLTKTKDPISTSVISILKQGGDTMPLYGLKGYHNLGVSHGFPDQRLTNIVKNVKDALQDEIKKDQGLPTSLFVLNQLTEEEKMKVKISIKQLDPNIEVIDLTAGEAILNITEQKNKNKIVVYITGGLPPDLFNYMIATSRIPPVGGGANFKQVMKQAKKPFLHTQSTSFDVEHAPVEWIREKFGPVIMLKPEYQKYSDQISGAWREVQLGTSRGDLSNFLKSSMEANSKLATFFEATSRVRPNKLYSAMDLMIQNVKKIDELNFASLHTNQLDFTSCQKMFTDI